MRYDQRAIRRLRLAKGIHAAELARRAGMTRQNVQLLEYGITEPKAKTLARLAKVLGCSVSEFFVDDEKAG